MQRWLVIGFVLLWLPWSGSAKEPKQVEKDTWKSLNTKAVEAYHAGRYQEGLAWAQQAYDYAQKFFGAQHPNTLTSLNNLAALYNSQGRYGEAEPLIPAI